MPALVNINVGSLRGTSGDDGTISWPFFLKKSRNVRRMSLTEAMDRFRERAPRAPAHLGPAAVCSGLSVADREPLCQAPAALLGRTACTPVRSRGPMAPRDVKERGSAGAKRPPS